MSDIRHRDRILEAIDQLRKRKARPDVNRICNFMFRRFSVNAIDTTVDLQRLIDAEIVIKVDYKGNTSYRNAAKWAMLPAYKYKKEIDTSSIICSAVAEIIVLEPDYLDLGVPQFELESHMQQKDSKKFTKKNLESIIKRELEIGTLVKLKNGNYFLGEHSPINSTNSTMDRPSGSDVGSPGKVPAKPTLIITPESRQRKMRILQAKLNNDNSNDSDKMKSDEHSNTSESSNVTFRVGGRQKRARIVFDPSDNNLPTRVNKKRGPGRPLGSLNKATLLNNSSSATPPVASHHTPKSHNIVSSASVKHSSVTTGSHVKSFHKTFDISSAPVNPGLCFKCHSYGQRVKGVPEKTIQCSYCTNRVHPSCLEDGEDSPDRDGAWQCSQCKSCSVCDKTGTLIVCVVCRDAYHYQCHAPPVTEKVRSKPGNWHCIKCSPSLESSPKESPNKECEPEKEFIAEMTSPFLDESSSISPEPRVRDVPAKCLQEPFEDIPIDESIPDPKHWSTNQVFQYLSTHLKPEIAQVFKDQDIDGQSLLLMKRMDVLTGLSLKVGPALKVYKQVRMLQTRKNHPRIFWS